jgi:hypothetical protein
MEKKLKSHNSKLFYEHDEGSSSSQRFDDKKASHFNDLAIFLKECRPNLNKAHISHFIGFATPRGTHLHTIANGFANQRTGYGGRDRDFARTHIGF